MTQAPGAPRERLFTGTFYNLWALSFVTFLSAFQLFPTVPFRILALGGSKGEAGLFLGLYTAAAALSAPLTGSIADHVGRRRLAIVASIAFVAFSLLYAVVTERSLLLAVAVVHGVLWSGILTASGGIMTNLIPASRRTEGLAYWGMASTVAIAVAPLIGLRLYQIGWNVMCFVMAGLSVVMAAIATVLPHDEPRPGARFPRINEIVAPKVVLTALSLTTVSFGYGGLTSYVALLSVERKIDPPSLFFTVFALMILVSRIFFGPVADKFTTKAMLYPAIIVMAMAIAILALGETKLWMIAAGALYGTGLGVAFPTFMSFVMGRTDPSRRGATFGNVIMAFDSGIGVGSAATGAVIQRFGYRPAFLGAALLSLGAIAVFQMTSKLWDDVEG
ncbi:MAG: MFS transporter [Acidobacteria bacterium]|nr:MFS transporter [Acidobacteriota bacterium]